MPYVKSISIHQTVNRSIAYILNPDKTEDLMYATSLNCLTNAADAYLAMRTVYEHFSGYKFNEPLPIKGKGRVKAIHFKALTLPIMFLQSLPIKSQRLLL